MTEDNITTTILLTVPEAARRLGIGRSTLYELEAAGAIRFVHIGRAVRVSARAVNEFVERLETQAAGLR